ncbi:MAG: tetratricopeptide repeat protein [Candidatus Azambacteria bacterium]|nr:tetratricopeptide repeat protein [Candidatus Azambacteria bacterium]
MTKFIQTPIEVSPSFGATMNIGLSNLKAGHYLMGSGPGTFSYIFNLYKPTGINQTIFWSTTFMTGASAMTSWLGTIGILGILALLFLIAAFIWIGIAGTAVRNSSRGIMNVASQAIFVAVSFLFIMWFLYVANFTVMAFTFWGMGLFLAASFLKPTPTLPYQGGSQLDFSPDKGRLGGVFRLFTSPPKTFLFSLLIVGLMVGVIIGIYFEANRYIAEIYFSKKDYASAIQFWQYDEQYFQSLSQAIFFQLNDLLANKNLPQDQMRTQFQNITSNAISAARQAQSLDPQNPFNSVLLGSIYENLVTFIPDAANFALSSYSGAVSLDPRNPSNYLALARVEVAQADLAVNQKASSDVINGYLDKAVANLNQSIALKDDYAPARFLLVQVYDREGKLTDAIKKAEELVALNNTDVGALFQLGFLYYKNNQFDQAKSVFERTIQLSPNYSNARYFLGLIYDGSTSLTTSERKAKAIEQFQKIAELNPDNNEVKQIIANLQAKKPALFGIAPPAPAPQSRTEAPVSEGTKTPVQKLKK